MNNSPKTEHLQSPLAQARRRATKALQRMRRFMAKAEAAANDWKAAKAEVANLEAELLAKETGGQLQAVLNAEGTAYELVVVPSERKADAR